MWSNYIFLTFVIILISSDVISAPLETSDKAEEAIKERKLDDEAGFVEKSQVENHRHHHKRRRKHRKLIVINGSYIILKDNKPKTK